MSRINRLSRTVLRLAAMLALGAAAGLHAYVLQASSWPKGTSTSPSTVKMQLQLQVGPPANRTLQDGSTAWNDVAQAALTDWNQYLVTLKFSWVNPSFQPIPTSSSSTNDNNVFWSSTVYGDSWGSSGDTVGITVTWYTGGTQTVETDVLFNNTIPWDSFRGNLQVGATDLKRIALHEFGHVLGLGHPDQAGQQVAAIMNSVESDTYDLTPDDIAGATYLYGAGSQANASPAFTLNPQPVTIAKGRSAAFSVAATGYPAPGYQWYRGSTAISGATDPILLVQAATSANAGSYTCVASNFVGSVTSSAATLTVDTTGTAGYLLNISTRGNVGLLSGDVGPGILFAGVGLSGSGEKTLLIRGGGPGLAYRFPTLFTSSDVVSTPRVALISADGTTLLDQNTVWGTTTILKDAFDLTGAFAFQDNSADSALLDTVPVANYNVEVTTSNGSTVPGIGLVEVYDADTGTPTAHIINLSARDYVGVGGHILIGGFVIGGTDYETLLVRSVGPGLYDKFPASFTSTNVLAQPVVTIVSGSTAIYSNTGWGGDTTLANAMATVGAYALNPLHQDSAMLVSLPPGNYTIIVSGVGGGTGQATVEFYDIP